MNPALLADLRDWHPPDPVSWWPPAPGWWLAAAVLLLLALGFALHGWRRRSAVVRAARRQLDVLARQLQQDGDRRRYLAGLSRLLRRLALARYPRHQVAGLSGIQWLDFLDATGGEGGFARGPGRVLIEAAYRPTREEEVVFDPERVRALVMRWIERNWGRGS